MATKALKTEVIRIRVTKETKDKLQSIANKNNITMSDILSSYIEKEIELHEFNSKYKQKIEERIEDTENKLSKLKHKKKW